jgi:hypothetical protein
MDVFTAWASLEFLVIVTVAVISIWRAMMYIFDLVETGAEQGLDFAIGKIKGR